MRLIKVSLSRYFDPTEDNHYEELLESVQIPPTRAQAHQWLRDNIISAASYDKHLVDEGHISIQDYFNSEYPSDELCYTFEVVEFTGHEDGRITEETIHVCKDTTYDFGMEE